MNTSHILAIDFETWIFAKRFRSLPLTLDQLRKMDNNYTPKVLTYLLKILKEYNQKTTFFVVTKFEELYPGIISKIQKEGHEVGWHTHTHARIDNKEVLAKELMLAEKIIKKYKIKGFQAPEIYFFSGGYKLLKEFGFIYSSSIYGDSQRIYNFDGVLELPVSVSNENYSPGKNEIKFPCNMQFTKLFQYGIPYGSSLLWSILQKSYYFNKLSKMSKENKRCNLFIHNWQLIRPKAKEYKKEISFFRMPLLLPYRINVLNMFEYLLANFSFRPVIDFI